jgi:trehalose 6-phosphate phosphatase
MDRRAAVACRIRVWEVLMKSRLYGPGRHQSFPVFNVIASICSHFQHGLIGAVAVARKAPPVHAILDRYASKVHAHRPPSFPGVVFNAGRATRADKLHCAINASLCSRFVSFARSRSHHQYWLRGVGAVRIIGSHCQAAARSCEFESLLAKNQRNRYGTRMLEPTMPDRHSALFLDFDGTLTDIAPRPQDVQVMAGLTPLLSQLAAALSGALAIVSGRPVSEIDHHLQPLTLPAAGVHGAERRGADGQLQRVAPCRGFDEAQASIELACRRYPALRMEVKPGAIALHYRQADSLEPECLAIMNLAMALAPDMTLMHGKKVLELKPRSANKGAAVRAFLEEPPFRSRRPWFFGDDVTDEAAFEAVQALGGVAVKIGEGDTMAVYGLSDPASLQRWIAAAVGHLGADAASQVMR